MHISGLVPLKNIKPDPVFIDSEVLFENRDLLKVFWKNYSWISWIKTRHCFNQMTSNTSLLNEFFDRLVRSIAGKITTAKVNYRFDGNHIFKD
jgi:hypothetical protein